MPATLDGPGYFRHGLRRAIRAVSGLHVAMEGVSEWRDEWSDLANVLRPDEGAWSVAIEGPPKWGYPVLVFEFVYDACPDDETRAELLDIWFGIDGSSCADLRLSYKNESGDTVPITDTADGVGIGAFLGGLKAVANAPHTAASRQKPA